MILSSAMSPRDSDDPAPAIPRNSAKEDGSPPAEELLQLRPRLVTLHGVWTAGRWQEEIAPVFAPFFRYQPVKYPHFRWYGPFALVLEPIVLIAGLLFAIWLWHGKHAMGWRLTLFSIVVVLVALITTGLRRRLALRHVIRSLGQEGAPGDRPHLIAHSYGSYLVGQMLQRPDCGFRRIVLVGAVLKPDYPFTVVQRGNGAQFEALKNEVGERDWIVRLAGWLRHVRDMGNAGLVGFGGDSTHVHTMDVADATCSQCTGVSPPTWIVHNVRIPVFSHNEQFIHEQYAAEHWLPFLLGLETADLKSWWELCRGGHWALTQQHEVDAQRAQHDLMTREWRWAGGTISEFISQYAPEAASQLAGSPLRQLRFQRLLFEAVALATLRLVDHGGDPERILAARSLDPRIAVFLVLRDVPRLEAP